MVDLRDHYWQKLEDIHNDVKELHTDFVAYKVEVETRFVTKKGLAALSTGVVALAALVIPFLS